MERGAEVFGEGGDDFDRLVFGGEEAELFGVEGESCDEGAFFEGGGGAGDAALCPAGVEVFLGLEGL